MSVQSYEDTIKQTERIYKATIFEHRRSYEGNTTFPHEVGHVRATVHSLNGESLWGKRIYFDGHCEASFHEFKTAILGALDWLDAELTKQE